MKRWYNGPLVSRFSLGTGTNWIYHMLLILLWLTLIDSEQMGVYSLHPFVRPLPPHAHSCAHTVLLLPMYRDPIRVVRGTSRNREFLWNCENISEICRGLRLFDVLSFCKFRKYCFKKISQFERKSLEIRVQKFCETQSYYSPRIHQQWLQ